ncbi:hypothetical protein ACFCW6_06890 [Streptomyces sp. NPDC056333]|uniref:hypothetical protein n=1 Tax=Streptomyces sp. NPDC056333 TaxID=3345786 RepID=UPI0035DF3016
MIQHGGKQAVPVREMTVEHLPDRPELTSGIVERTRVVVGQDGERQPLGVRVRPRQAVTSRQIGAARLATGRGDAMLRRYVEQCVDAVVRRRVDELFRDGHRRGLPAVAPPELLSEITLLTSWLPRECEWSATGPSRATGDTVL